MSTTTQPQNMSSSMRRPRRKWTPDEDQLLRQLVNSALAESRPLLWREIAKFIPGRSNKDCRRRWWNTLADGTAKGAWSEEEDERLIHAIQKHGLNWRIVARSVQSRTPDQCSSHWCQVLDPEINHSDWSLQEDELLLHEVLTHGTNWSTVAATHTPKRTTLSLKNRYSTLRLRHTNVSKSQQGTSSDGDFDQEQSSGSRTSSNASANVSASASANGDDSESEDENYLAGDDMDADQQQFSYADPNDMHMHIDTAWMHPHTDTGLFTPSTFHTTSSGTSLDAFITDADLQANCGQLLDESATQQPQTISPTSCEYDSSLSASASVSASMDSTMTFDSLNRDIMSILEPMTPMESCDAMADSHIQMPEGIVINDEEDCHKLLAESESNPLLSACNLSVQISCKGSQLETIMNLLSNAEVSYSFKVDVN